MLNKHYNTEFLEYNAISYIKQVFPIFLKPQIPLLTLDLEEYYSGYDCVIIVLTILVYWVLDYNYL